MNTKSMTLRKIDKECAISFIRQYHYSKIMPRLTKHYLGYYCGHTLCGVVTLGWGTQPMGTLRKLFPNHDLTSEAYYEIGKMCFLPRLNGTNKSGSQAMALLVKWMKKHTKCLFLYTMADGIMGKCGYVYQASNFRYIGKYRTQVYRIHKTGEKVHPRSAKGLLEENARERGRQKMCWLDVQYCAEHGIDFLEGFMFRYIYPLNRKAKKILDSYPKYKCLANPKASDLKYFLRTGYKQYSEIEQPKFNMNACEYNPQKFPTTALTTAQIDAARKDAYNSYIRISLLRMFYGDTFAIAIRNQQRQDAETYIATTQTRDKWYANSLRMHRPSYHTKIALPDKGRTVLL